MALLARYMDSLIAGKYLPTNPCVVKKVYASSLPRARENAGEGDVLAVAGRGERGRRKKSRRRMDE